MPGPSGIATVRPLSVPGVWAESWRTLVADRHALLRAITLPTLAQALLILGMDSASPRPPPLLTLFGVIACLCLLAWTAISVHRLALRDRPGRSHRENGITIKLALRFAGRLLMAWMVVMGASIWIGIALQGVAGWLPPPPSVWEPGILPSAVELISLLTIVVMLWLLMRVVLMLPACALGDDDSLDQTLHLSRGQGWRLLLALLPTIVVVALGLGLVDHLVKRLNGPALAAASAVVVSLMLVPLAVVLSHAYRQLLEAYDMSVSEQCRELEA